MEKKQTENAWLVPLVIFLLIGGGALGFLGGEEYASTKCVERSQALPVMQPEQCTTGWYKMRWENSSVQMKILYEPGFSVGDTVVVDILDAERGRVPERAIITAINLPE